MIFSSRRLRTHAGALLTTTALAAFAIPSAALACPLGAHHGPPGQLLHSPAQARAGQVGATRIAQAQHHGPVQTPARTEVGAYSRDLPKGAAAPRGEAQPPLYGNLGTLSWTEAGPPDSRARAYFDQGYRLAWAFNHAEAARAFRAAQDLDPNCVMCLWGEAWVLGPHINYPMDPDANARAVAALARARQLAPAAGKLESALVEALSRRHSSDPTADRKALDQAYADAMEAVQVQFPESPHVALLTADALMNLSPWDYWTDGGRTPKGKADRMLSLIEGVLGERPVGSLVPLPDHPGAIHLYIHAVEASDHPERAAPHAARLAGLMPGAGHLVHMPSHIWYRLGRWRESLEANLRAAAADEAFLKAGGSSVLYAEGYYAHNVHFVLASAVMGGDGQTAVAAAEKLAGLVSDRAKREVPWTQPIAAAPYSTHARFSAPEVVLALPAPDDAYPLVRGTWHYARGVALARLGRLAEAQAEAAAIEGLARKPEAAALTDAGVPVTDVLTIAARVVEARAAQAAEDHATAVILFRNAAEIQDRLPYMEPPFWYYPVHQSLGAALLAVGRVEEAEAAFRTALERSPNNGWAAAGLLRAAERRGDANAIEGARELLAKSWLGDQQPPLDRL